MTDMKVHLIFVTVLFILLGFGIFKSEQQSAYERAECRNLGGVKYEQPRGSSAICWRSDGTRLFPEQERHRRMSK